jgi:hypothetical protein
VQIHLVTLLVLTFSAQVKKEPRPIPAPPLASNVVHVRFATNGGVHTISLVQPAPPTPADEEGEQPPLPLAALPMRFNLNTMVVERENFDRWLFADERTEGERWTHLDEILEAKVGVAGKEHKLTDRQRAKLKLAGRGDIKRFFDRVEENRIDFEVQRQTYRTGRAALLRLDPLLQVYREGPFGDGSLFAKTLRRINDDQKDGD